MTIPVQGGSGLARLGCKSRRCEDRNIMFVNRSGNKYSTTAATSALARRPWSMFDFGAFSIRGIGSAKTGRDWRLQRYLPAESKQVISNGRSITQH